MARNTQRVTAPALKDALWDTMTELRENKIDPAVADSIASQAREIIRTSRLQLNISRQAKVDVPQELLTFANPPSE